MHERSSPSARRATDRLRALAGDSSRQADFAVEVLASESSTEAVLAALAVLEAHPRDEAREALIAQHDAFAAARGRRDPGGFTRAAIIRALTLIALEREAPLFERAATTAEPTPQDPGGPSALRAAGLVALAKVSPHRAALRAASALADVGSAASGNGEPAVTAARVLAWLEERAALVTFLQALPRGPDEAVAEALKGLAGGPGDIIASVAEPFANDRREIVLAGLCDLYVEHRADDALLPDIARFLGAPGTHDVYAYLIAAMVASRRGELLQLLAEHATFEHREPKLRALAEALALSPDPLAARTIAAIERRLSSGHLDRPPDTSADTDEDRPTDPEDVIRRARASVAAKRYDPPRTR